jgi:hypothetical protein
MEAARRGRRQDRIVYALVAVAILLIAAMSILLFRFIFN